MEFKGNRMTNLDLANRFPQNTGLEINELGTKTKFEGKNHADRRLDPLTFGTILTSTNVCYYRAESFSPTFV